MYLKRLELIGFKSFAEKTELEFGPGITAVVGPNGSGKSNVCEAVRWVLGELNARELRGTRMEDVIFAGSDTKKPLGYAQVTITFDNSDGALPVAFSEVQISRRVDRAGDSEYLINNVSCRLKDVLDLFLDTGIGKENYSVIGQGRIDQILSAKPEERRAIFEEAAGIARYKARKREAARRLEDTEQNLLRLSDLIGELEGRLDELAEQAETARQYRSLQEELDALEIGLLARGLKTAADECAAWRARVDEYRAELQRADGQQADLESALESARALAGALEQEAAAVQASLVEATAAWERAEARLKLLQQEEGQAAREQERLAAEAENLAERERRLQADQAGVRDRLAAAGEALAGLRQELDRQESDWRSLQEALAAAVAAQESLRQQAHAAERAAAEQRNLAQSEGKARDAAAQRAAHLQEQENAARDRGAAAERAAAAAAERLNAGRERREALVAALAAARQRRDQHRQEEQAATEQMSQLRERIQGAAARLELLEEMKAAFEGFARGTRAVLQARDQGRPWAAGIVGAVAELVRTEPRYERAIETALGPGLQNVVVASDHDAKACIRELKRQGAGRATFLPLNIIRPAAFRPDEEQALASVPGFIGCALDLCRFEAAHRPALAYLLGRVAVAADMDAALAIGRKTGFRQRVVTLDGEILMPGGALTGGSVEGRNAGLLSREREREELAAQMPVLRRDLEAARGALAGARSAAEAAAQQQRELAEDLRRLELDLAAMDGERQRHQSDARHWAEQAAALAAERDRVAAEAASGDAVARRLQDEAEQLAAGHQRLLARLQATAAQHQELGAREKAAAAAVTEARVRIAEVTQQERALQEEAQRLAGEAEALAAAATSQATAAAALARRREELAATVVTAAAALQEAGARRDELGARQAEVQSRRLAVAREATDRERELRTLRRRQQDLLGKAAEADAAIARLEAELQALGDRLADQFGLAPAAVAGREVAPAAVPQSRQRVQELRENIRDLGAVNLAAIDEHARAQERHGFLVQQRGDLEEAKAALYRAIEELDRRIVSRFRESFTEIAAEFRRVYQELFEGGRADLVLVDESNLLETGIEIICQPPGKKLTPLSLLSGGERAMTAIALVFALLRYKPSPFVVLDEVDAALDEANVERFGRYLKEMAGDCQFICISHQRGTMEVADALYGVTMEGTGVSRIVSVRFSDVAPPARTA